MWLLKKLVGVVDKTGMAAKLFTQALCTYHQAPSYVYQ